MNILYISSLVRRKASSASIRNTSLINGLIELGHSVDVVTVDYPDAMIDPFLKKFSSFNSSLTTVRTSMYSQMARNYQDVQSKQSRMWMKLIKSAIKEALLFPDFDFDFPKKVTGLELNLRKYDLIISSSDTKTSHFAAKSLNYENKLKWIQIWGDPWADDINLNWLNRQRAKIYETYILNRADFIFYVSHPTLCVMKDRYPYLAKKMGHINRSFFVRAEKKNIQKEHVKFTYTGQITRHRNLINLCEKIEIYNKSHQKPIILEIVGRCDPKVQKEIEKFHFIKFHGVQDLEFVNKLYCSSDVLVFVDNSSASHQIPGKLYDYFGTECEILSLVDHFEQPVARFIDSTKRCIQMENAKDKIDLSFVKNLEKRRVLVSYSPVEVAKQLLEQVN
jgi:hypothetical protein